MIWTQYLIFWIYRTINHYHHNHHHRYHHQHHHQHHHCNIASSSKHSVWFWPLQSSTESFQCFATSKQAIEMVVGSRHHSFHLQINQINQINHATISQSQIKSELAPLKWCIYQIRFIKFIICDISWWIHHHHEVHHKVCQTHGIRGAVSSGSQQPCRKLSW